MFVKLVIKEGYKSSFKNMPEDYRYEERNNKSYEEHRCADKISKDFDFSDFSLSYKDFDMMMSRDSR